GCSGASKAHPFVATIVDRISDDVHFWIDKTTAPGCGGKPKAHVTCTVEGQSSDKTIKAAPGQTVNCDSQTSVPGASGSITDRAWALTERAFGSTAMMKLSPDRTTASFITDAFGKYNVRLQVSDQEAKGDEATLSVEVSTPKDAIVLEMGWTKFDRN